MEIVTVHRRGPIAVIVLNNPRKLSALSSQGYFLLGERLRSVAKDSGIAVTIVTGKGKFFSAGVELQKLDSSTVASSTNTTDPVRQRSSRDLAHIIDVTEAFYTHPKILVAALNGPAIGLSAALVAHCDFIYASPTVFFQTPFANLNIVSEGAASITFLQRLGPKLALDALLTGRRVSCEELVAAGLINNVFDTQGNDEIFLQHVLTEVERFGAHGTKADAMLQIKTLVRHHQLPLLESQTLHETLAVVGRVTEGPERLQDAKLKSKI